MMKLIIKKYWSFILFILFVIYINISMFFNSRKESMSCYNLVISKIHVNPTGNLVLYANEKQIVLSNFNIRDNEGVEVGDSIFKEKCGKYLYIYKKDNQTSKYKLYLKEVPTGIFPNEWFCN